MKSSYEVRASKFVKLIAPFLCECNRVGEYMNAVEKFNIRYNRHVIVRFGLSRVALITSDYVIKIDYADTAWGGCEKEYNNYQDAKRDGFGYLFAPITPVIVMGRVFWIMPRIRCIGGRYNNDNDVYEYLTTEENDYLWDNEFGDLHSENYGWKNGHPVIVDYACRH